MDATDANRNPCSSRPSLSLCTLPLESRQAILCRLPDIQTLAAAVQSHPAVYAAFANRKQYILCQVLSNVVSSELLPDALFAFQASSLETEPWTREKVLSIVERYRNRQNHHLLSANLTLQDAMAIQGFYNDSISFFTLGYLSTALSDNPVLSLVRSPSTTEWCRVARSFYRFEIHRHLFRHRDIKSPRNAAKPSPDFRYLEKWDVYYRDFAVWELEQLACVSEYLFRNIAVPFNECAAHDVEWADRAIGYSLMESWEVGYGLSHIEHLLTQGISFLKTVITAGTYEERYQLLSPQAEDIGGLLPQDLQCIFPLGDVDDDQPAPFKDYTRQQQASLLSSRLLESAIVDRDYNCHGPTSTTTTSTTNFGPAEAWCWAHLELTWQDFVVSRKTRDLRRWGYVMWDHSRLVDSGVLDLPFDVPPRLDYDELYRRQEAAIESILKRKRLQMLGASGWWAEGDESRLVWGGPCYYNLDMEWDRHVFEDELESFQHIIFF